MSDAAADAPRGGFDFEVVLETIGQFGWWQKKIFLWLWIVSGFNGIATLAYAFVGYVPKYRCAVPHCADEFYNSDDDFVTIGTPNYSLASDTSCHVYDYINDTYFGDEASSCQAYIDDILTNKTGSIIDLKCSHDNLIFDSEVVTSSIVTEYGLTCDKKFIKNVIGAVYMVGLMVGSLGFGLLADKIGRMKALMVGLCMTSISGSLGAFMPDVISFGIMRFLSGVGAKGLFMIAFVLCVEFTGPQYSAYLGIAIEIPFALGEMVLGLQAYFVRDWMQLQLVAYAPIILACLLYFVIPESPRWLLASGKMDEAKQIAIKGGDSNGIKIPEELLSGRYVKQSRKETPKLNLLDTLRPLPMLWRSLNLYLQWFSVTFCYYGLAYGSTNLLGDVHRNYLLTAFFEIPGYLFAMLVMDCWGRRPILAFCQALAGLGCIVAGLLVSYQDWAVIQVCFSLLGKMMASASFAIVYQYTAELFPTAIRTTAVGNCSTIARFGAVFALLVDAMADIWGPLPMVLMGSIAVFAGFVAALLPETAGLPLPETVEDALAISEKNAKRGFCTCICHWPFQAK